MGTKTECAIHLENSFLTADEAVALAKEVGAMDDLGPDERTFRKFLAEKVEDKIDHEIKQLHDGYVQQNSFNKDATGVTSMHQLLQNKEKRLFGRNSVDTTRRSHKNTLITKYDEYERMFGIESDDGVRATEQDSALEGELYKAVRELDFRAHVKDINKLTPEIAAQLAKGKTNVERSALAMAAYNEYARSFMHRHGISVKYAKNYVIKRRYDSAKLETLGEAGFVDFMFEKLDIEKTFGRVSEKDAKKLISNVFKQIEGESGIKTNMLEFDNKKSSANSLTRKFVFDGADSEYDAFRELSIGGLKNQLEENAWGMATTAVKIDNFGYDHQAVASGYDSMVSKQFGAQKGNFQKIMNVYRDHRIKQAEADFTGQNMYASTGLSTAATTFKTITALSKLGNTLNVAILDPLDTARQNFYVNGEFFGGALKYKKNMALIAKEFAKDKVNGTSNLRMVAEHMGVVMHYFSSDTSMRVARGDLATSGGSKWARGLEKHGNKAMSVATFLPQQTAWSKLSSAATGAQIFTDMMDKIKIKDGKIDATGLNKFEVDTFREYDIKAREMGVLKEVEGLVTWSDQKILSGKSIRDHVLQANPEQMAAKLGVDVTEVGQAALNLSLKYDNYVNDFFTRGTPTPELSAKTALLKGSKSELSNVVIGLMTQFMDTPVMQLQSFVEMTDKLKRLNGAEGQSLLSKDALNVMRAVGPEALAQGVPHALVGSAMYVGFNVMWSAAMGKEDIIDRYNRSDTKGRRAIMLDITGRTSVIPFAFEFANNATSNYYNVNALSTLKSPAASFVSDAFDVMKPEDSAGSKSALDFAKRQIPNAWMIQAVRNRMKD